MNIDLIQNPVLKAQFQAIAGMTIDELAELDLTPKIRDTYLEYVIVPTDPGDEVLDQCWGWSGTTVNSPARGIIFGRGTNLYIYRVAFELHHRRRIRPGKWMCHTCPNHENPICSNLGHVIEGTAKLNAEHREFYGTNACGDRNGSRLHPESRPRGMNHSKCPFDDARDIQAIRATYHAAREKFGVISALVRYTGYTKAAVTGAIHKYSDVPDDPTAALDLSALDIRRPQDRTGDHHGRSLMPEAAVKLFYQLFHTSSDRAGKRRLVEFVTEKFGMAPESLDDIAHRRSRKKATEGLAEVIAAAPPTDITDELLATLFQPYAPLREVAKV